MASFPGDTSIFEAVRPHLEKCLVGQGDAESQPKSSSKAAKPIFFGVPLLLVSFLAGWWILSERAQRRWQNVVERIGAQPGIVITASGEREGRYFISGLRDPLAADPAALLRGAGISSDRVAFRWEAYHSLQPQFTARRQYEAAKERLQKQEIRFALGSSRILPEQQYAVSEAALQVGALFDAAAASNQNVSVEILGGADATGREALNATLAKDRASALQSALSVRGIPAERISAKGLSVPCALSPTGTAEHCRAAAFHVLEGAQ